MNVHSYTMSAGAVRYYATAARPLLIDDFGNVIDDDPPAANRRVYPGAVSAEVHRRAQEHIRLGRAKAYSQAVQRVLDDDPELAQIYALSG